MAGGYNRDLEKCTDETFYPGLAAQFQAVPTETCEVHEEPLVMYCKQHDAVGCNTCMVDQHRDCQDYIESNTRHISQQLDTIANRIEKLRQDLIKDEENLTNGREQTLQQIRSFKIKLIKHFDKLETNTIRMMEKEFQSRFKAVEVELKNLQELINEIEYTKESLKTSVRNPSQTFVRIKNANNVASFTIEKADKIASQVFFTEITFANDPKLQSMLCELKELGSFFFTESFQVTNQSQNPNLPVISMPCNSLLKVDVNKMERIRVSEHTCDIVSACTLTDGTIILSDYYNNNLKHINSSSYTVIGYCTVPQKPCQVCAISSEEVAVCCLNTKLVKFVAIGSTMHMTREIRTGVKCYGLAYVDENLFLSDETSVFEYTLAGNLLKQFSKNQYGQVLFSCIYSLAVSRDNSKIYVADFKQGLIILNRDGQGRRVYNRHLLPEACGVLSFTNESILVCEYKSRNVLQFSTDGRFIGEVLKRDEHCISVCSNKENLIITFENTDEIEVSPILSHEHEFIEAVS